jgi:hypothetical protein
MVQGEGLAIHSWAGSLFPTQEVLPAGNLVGLGIERVWEQGSCWWLQVSRGLAGG